ncbi:MAG: O-antigen ligase family protein, partial [Gammaproteobacteria bacterium]|nr:O-antigen ligase family protein [Gammaproteobacteria bacterium]
IYFGIVIIGFYRLMTDLSGIYEWAYLHRKEPPSTGNLWGENLINVLKWVIPGLLLYDGCRDRQRFLWGVTALLGIYFLLAVQIIRWMPLEMLGGGSDLEARSGKILLNEIGYHRVNMAMLMAGGAWAIYAAKALFEKRLYIWLVIGASAATVFALALTGGRTGYATWAVIGVALSLLRWRKFLILGPAIAAAVLLLVPAAQERMLQGMNPDEYQPRVHGPVSPSPDEPDLYTVTAGRNIAWPVIIDKIMEAPWVGYGREAMQRTGLAAILWSDYGESFPHPHNAYLQWLLDNGLLGFIPVILFYLLMLSYSMSLFRDSRDKIFVAIGGIALALLLALLAASVGSQSFYPREGAVGMWCAIGLMLRVYVERARQFADAPVEDLDSVSGSQLWGKPA